MNEPKNKRFASSFLTFIAVIVGMACIVGCTRTERLSCENGKCPPGGYCNPEDSKCYPIPEAGLPDDMSMDQKLGDGISLDQNTDGITLKKNGVSCKSGSECTSTRCVEGVCCDKLCDGICKSCKVSGKVGKCSNVPNGQDPKNNCAGTNASCSGSCNGNGACTYPGSSTSCGKDACSEGKHTTHRCDSKGGCKTTTTNVGVGWAIPVPGEVRAIFPLSYGATVISGWFYREAEATFGETKLTYGNLYIAKIDNSGNFVWATAPKGDLGYNPPESIDLYIDPYGNSYIVGKASIDAPQPHIVTFGDTTLKFGGYEHEGYVAKLDFNGKFTWAEKLGGDISSAKAVSGDAKGNVYIAGFFGIEIMIGGKTEKPGDSDIHVFLTKFDPDGKHIWTKTTKALKNTTKGSEGEDVDDMVLDSSGNVYMIGTFNSPTFGFGKKSVNTKGDYDIYVAKVSPNGDVLWLVGAGGTGDDRSSSNSYYKKENSIAIDKNGGLYISGYRRSGTFGTKSLKGDDYFIAKLSSEKGNFDWVKNAGGVTVKKVVAGIDGHLYTTGEFTGKKKFGSLTYTSKGSDPEVYIARVSPSTGDYIKAEVSWGGATPYDLSGISSGYLFSAGKFKGPTALGSFSLAKGPGYVWNLNCSSVYP